MKFCDLVNKIMEELNFKELEKREICSFCDFEGTLEHYKGVIMGEIKNRATSFNELEFNIEEEAIEEIKKVVQDLIDNDYSCNNKEYYDIQHGIRSIEPYMKWGEWEYDELMETVVFDKEGNFIGFENSELGENYNPNWEVGEWENYDIKGFYNKRLEYSSSILYDIEDNKEINIKLIEPYLIQWSYTFDEEGQTWNGGIFDTKEEALQEALKEAKGYNKKKVTIGKCVLVDKIGIDIDFVLEDISNTMQDNYGEVAEDYLNNVLKEHKLEVEKELNEVFFKWLDKYNYEPNFYNIEDTEIIEIENTKENKK